MVTRNSDTDYYFDRLVHAPLGRPWRNKFVRLSPTEIESIFGTVESRSNGSRREKAKKKSQLQSPRLETMPKL